MESGKKTRMARPRWMDAYNHGVRWAAIAAAVFAGASFVYIVVATTLGVINRRVLEAPSRFLFDSVEVAMGITVFFSLAFVALRNGHVRMEVLPASLSRLRAVLDRVAAVGSAVILGAYSVVVFRQFLHDLSLGVRIGSNIGLPRWIPMLALSIGLVLFALTLLRTRALSDSPSDEKAPTP